MTERETDLVEEKNNDGEVCRCFLAVKCEVACFGQAE